MPHGQNNADDPIDDSNTRREFPEIPIDRYKIVQHIGKGAFSRVFLAYTPEFQRRAIKRIRLTAKPHMLLKEIEFLRRLEGKDNIVQIKEIRFHDLNLQTTVITNYLDSDDFKSIILEFTPREIQAYMRSLLTALSHLEKAPDPHNADLRGILHRDVKPGNFLFERATGKGLLIDFGLAQSIKEAREFPLMRQSRRQQQQGQTQSQGQQQNVFQRAYEIAGYINKEFTATKNLPTQPHSGTHGYRAPEILVPVRNQDTKIDSWSAGVILLQIITGKTSIFRGNPNTDVYELLAIRSIIGTDRFIQGMSRLRADFSLTAGIAMPQNISLEELCEWYNPDLLAVLPQTAFDLCRRLLEFDPQARLSASQALQHPFLTTPANLLPDFRYQDGACNKSVVAFLKDQNMRKDNDESQLAALRKRSQDIADLLGLCKSTAETLSEEYSRMILSQMIPLPKDIRRQIERAVQKSGADRSCQSPCGLIIERPKASDYQFPINQAVQDLSSCQQTTLAKPRLASAPGWQARPAHCEAEAQKAVEAAIKELEQSEEYSKLSQDQREKAKAKRERKVRRQVYDKLWEEANVEKERFERAVRATAFRRRVDPWVQPLKALDKELRLAQHQVRLAAEEYRRVVIERGLVMVDDQQNGDQKQNASASQVGKSQSETTKQDGGHPNKQGKAAGQQPHKTIVKSADGKLSVKNSDDAVLPAGKYGGTYTTDQIAQARLVSFMLQEQQNSKPAREIAAHAWAIAEKNALSRQSTDPTVQRLEKLNAQAARLATVSHRIALNGPAGWNVQGYAYYDKKAAPDTYVKQNYNQDVAARAYQFQRSIQMLYNQLNQTTEQLEQVLVFTQQNEQDQQRYKQQIQSLQTNPPKGVIPKQELQILETNLKQATELLQSYARQREQLEKAAEQIRADIAQQQKERAECIDVYLRTAPEQEPRDFNVQELENTSNIWSETVTVSDEFSEIRPTEEALRKAGVDYDPNQLQEPYFASQDEIKRAFQEADALTLKRKERRERVRKFEAVRAKFYDPSLQELQTLQRQIVQERRDLIEKMAKQQDDKNKPQQEVKRLHNGILPVEAAGYGPAMLSQVVALRQIMGRMGEVKRRMKERDSLGAKIDETDDNGTISPPSGETGQSGNAFAQEIFRRNLDAEVAQRAAVQRKANALYNLFASPLGRYYMVFHRLLGGNPQEMTERGALLNMARKAELPIPQELTELQAALQRLAASYMRSAAGRRDMVLVAAAVQSELDLRSDYAQNSELANMGLSRRAPNLEYLLQIHGKLSPLVRPMEDNNTRSTSAITGLTKSATHRSLADPGRTQSRYPQTSKYIQTMLEQTMKRYVTLPGVLDATAAEMRAAVAAIKARMFDVCVEEAYRGARGAERLWLGRVRDAVRALGAEAVYAVARGVAFPERCAAPAGAPLARAAEEARTRRLLLQDRYGGRRHRKALGWQ